MNKSMRYWEDKVEETGLYYVNFWGSDPAEDNDDCWTGRGFASESEAREFYEDPMSYCESHEYGVEGTRVLQLIGPGVSETRPFVVGSDDSDDMSDWKRERATQAGMMGGCAAYNEAMGY